MSCLTVNALGEALVLGALELELEHPAIPSRPAATTVAPSQVAVRRLKIFTKLFVCDLSDARCSGVQRADERPMARRGTNSIHLVNAVPSKCHGRWSPSAAPPWPGIRGQARR